MFESQISKNNVKINEVKNISNIGTDYSYKHEIVWKNVLFYLILHVFALWGILLMVTGRIKLLAIAWTFFVAYANTEGITMGAHRLYSHRSFKASPLLKAILLLLHTGAGENSVYTWARDHILHHRYSDTDADPHNAKRGFFFSHMGWLMVKKHPYVIELGRSIDMSDLKADWMVMFQKRYFKQIYLLIGVIIPVWVPIHFFGQTVWESLLVNYFFRYTIVLHGTWLVNSAAHLWGFRPYDKDIQPVENEIVSFVTWGEGWHNYHHTFPWDYKAAELSMHFNYTASLIRFFEKIGLAHDLKTASSEIIEKRILRTGDGNHQTQKKLLH